MPRIEEIKQDLLAWAGLHRGKAIDETAMPRFHEIIDKMEIAEERVGALLCVCNNCGFWRVFSSFTELLEVNENHCDSVFCPKCCDLMEQVQDDHKLVIVEHGAIERMKHYFRQAIEKEGHQ